MSSTDTGSLAGGRRFWATVAFFALINVAAWVAYDRFVSPRRDLLRVESGPAENGVVAGRPVLTWKFNLDVRPPAAGEPAPGLIEPAVAGRWEWRDARTLTFQPDADLPKARKVTFTLAPERIRTAEGFGLGRAHVVNVRTSPLQVLSARQAGIEDGNRFVIEIGFNDRVIPADAIAKLKLTGPDGKPLGTKAHGQGVGPIVRVLTDSVPPAPAREEAVKLRLHLDAGLAGTSGPLGLEHPYDASVMLDKVLAITQASADANTRGKVEIRLHVNGDLDAAAARQVISVEPAVAFNVQSHWSGLKLVGDFEPAKRYAIKIAAPPAGLDARKFPRADTLSVFVPERSPGAWFEHEEGYLGASGNRTLMAHAVNVPELKVELYRVYDSNLVAWRNSGSRYRWRDPSPFAKPIATKSIKLPQEKNKIQDVRVSLDDLLPADCPRDGVYRVTIAGSNTRPSYDEADGEVPLRGYDDYYGDSSGSAVFTLSDIGLTAKSARESLTVWAVSLSTARPMRGVRVRVFSNKNQPMGEAVTNSDGLARIDGLKLLEGEGPAVMLADVPHDGVLPTLAAIVPTTGPSTRAVEHDALATTQPSPLPSSGVPGGGSKRPRPRIDLA